MEIKTFDDVELRLNKSPNRYFSTASFQSFLSQLKDWYDKETKDIKKEAIANKAVNFIITVDNIYKVWPDLPVDYLNNYRYLIFNGIQIYGYKEENPLGCGFNNPKVAEWFQTYMKPRSFFNMLHVYCLREGRNFLMNSDSNAKYAERRYSNVPECIAVQNETSAEKLDELARSEDEGILYYVAKNPNTSPETLAYIGQMNQWRQCVIREVALNPNTPANIRDFFFIQKGSENTNRTFKDTLVQLEELLEKNKEMNPRALNEDGEPMLSRWRLMMFHDYVSLEYLKQEIVNVEFTHNTLKEPYHEGSWVISSPRDSLSLAVWAHKVHNCVRQRESRVQAGTSEILFIEQNGDPVYTVEIAGPKERKGNQLTIHEIQKFGLGPGQTKENSEIRQLIGRALGLSVV